MNIDTLYHRLGITPTQLAEFCQTAQIIELALFGSILRDDFRPDSDIDMLVTFTPDCKLDLMGFVQLEYDLEDWLHREVDLVSKRAVESDRNWLRRQEILNNYQVIYESKSLLPTED
jgi:predicted nucleotidyltransferase